MIAGAHTFARVRWGRLAHWISAQRRVLGAMATVGMWTLVVKVAATGKDAVVARAFGTSDIMDAFLVAFLLPSFAIMVIAGALPPALIPVYVRVRAQEDAESARVLLSTVLCFGAILLLLVSVTLAALAPLVLPAIAIGFDGAKLQTAQLLFLLLLPAVLLNGLSSMGAAALNAGDRYLLTSVAPLLTPLAIVGLLVYPQSWGIHALVSGILLGMMLEAAVLGHSLVRLRLITLPRFRNLHPALPEVARQYWPAVVGSAVMSSAALVDQTMAASLGAGSVSFLNYGSKLVMGLLGIGVFALATPILPLFSRLVEARNWEGIRSALGSFARLVVVVTVPATLVLVWWSEDLVRLLFERGAFGASDTHMVARVQMMYSLQAPFYVLGVIGVRLLSAFGRNQTVMWISGANLGVNILGNLIFMHFWGVSGIALSTSLVYLVSCVLIFTILFRTIRGEAELAR